MTAEGISFEEAEHRFNVDRAAGLFQHEVAAKWPDTFGGLWVDVEDFGVVVAFTANAEARIAELREEFPYPDVLRPTAAVVSLGELEEVLEGGVPGLV